jgi:hypothetical protein
MVADAAIARPALATLSVLCVAGLLAGCGSQTHARSNGASRGRGENDLNGEPNPWPAPSMRSPVTIDLTPSRTNLTLKPNVDYVLNLPRDEPLRAPQGLHVDGGHNVVMTGGVVDVPDAARALYLSDQTGIVHIEGVRFTGKELTEGIDLSEARGATVELEDIVIPEVHGSYTTNHADLIQTWAGPKRLLVDGFAGSTDYQGFFLAPNQLYSGPPPRLFELRNVFIDDRVGDYALWRAPGFPMKVEDVQIEPNPKRPERDYWLWPKPSTGSRDWDAVRVGTGGQALQDVSAAGLKYPGIAPAPSALPPVEASSGFRGAPSEGAAMTHEAN